jgi:hypothetical protein
VIGEIRSGESFRGLTHYLLHGSAATRAKTPEWVELRHLASRDPDGAWVEMEATASKNPQVKKPVFHVMISPAPGDELVEGEELEGFVTREGGDDLDVRNILGITTTLAKKDIAERGQRDSSMMPAGLLDKLTAADLAALLAYLESLKSK